MIFIVGNLTAIRMAGGACERADRDQIECLCTPYKQNTKGSKKCKVSSTFTPGENDDVGNINSYSYLRHEFEQAKRKKKNIIIVYNSTRNETSWLPQYMSGYDEIAKPFWKLDDYGKRVGDYSHIKDVLGF